MISKPCPQGNTEQLAAALKVPPWLGLAIQNNKLSVPVYEHGKVVLQVLEGMFQLLEIVVKPFVIVDCVVVDLAVMEFHFGVDLLLMRADGVFEIVDVQLLDVELVVKMINLDEYFLSTLFSGHILQTGV